MSNNVKCRKKTTNKIREEEKVIPFAYLLLYIENIIKCFIFYFSGYFDAFEVGVKHANASELAQAKHYRREENTLEILQ